MRQAPHCDCARRFRVVPGDEGEYRRTKSVLNRGRHPTFVGRDTVERQAKNGGLLFVTVSGDDLAVAVVNAKTGVLLVFNVVPEHRSHGLGRAVINHIIPNFVRAVEHAVPWFERLGYQAVGDWIEGRSLRTRVLVREQLFALAGKLQGLDAAGKLRCREVPEAKTPWDGYGRFEWLRAGKNPVPIVGKGPG